VDISTDFNSIDHPPRGCFVLLEDSRNWIVEFRVPVRHGFYSMVQLSNANGREDGEKESAAVKIEPLGAALSDIANPEQNRNAQW